jgi:hypothetical protein
MTGLLTTPALSYWGGWSSDRFLVNTFRWDTNHLGYVTRKQTAAANDNPRWKGYGLTQLIRGREWEVLVKARLMTLGLTEVELTQNFDGNEAGDADIWVNNTHIIEVKSYNYQFTNADDYPYQYVYTNSVDDVNTKHTAALMRRGGSLIFVVCSQTTGARICTRYKPEVDTLTRNNPRGIETLVIPRERWRTMETLAEWLLLPPHNK